MTAYKIPQAGHNKPPSDEEILAEKLKTNYAAEIQKIEDLGKIEVADVVDDETAGMLSAASECAAHNPWKPIETAPRDKWLLLGYFNSLGKWRTVRGNWFSADEIADQWGDFDGDPEDSEGWYETADNAEDIPNVWPINPTHWMPLPAAPDLNGDG